MQDGDISLTEFHKVLQEVEKYRKLKAEITKEQREEILSKEEKKAKKIFYEKSQILPVPKVSVPFKI